VKDVVIQVHEVRKSFGRREVLRGITFAVYRSEIVGLLGPSGAGKTTLVKMVAGIDEATEGVIKVLGEKMPHLGMLKRIGYMAQSDALYGELSAWENLRFFGQLYGLRGKRLKERVEEVMDLVDLTQDLHKRIHQFSGGMKRRLSLAIALLHEPEVLILDEPTVGIDPLLRQALWNELKRVSRAGTTIVVTTHVMDEAEKCDRLGMLREGQLIAVGTPRELKEQTQTETIEEAFLAFGGAHL
jgi:ABC-2 type transport system ATP-binding protein